MGEALLLELIKDLLSCLGALDMLICQHILWHPFVTDESHPSLLLDTVKGFCALGKRSQGKSHTDVYFHLAVVCFRWW